MTHLGFGLHSFWGYSGPGIGKSILGRPFLHFSRNLNYFRGFRTLDELVGRSYAQR